MRAFLFLVLLLCAASAAAQPRFTARASAAVIGPDDEVELVFSLENAAPVSNITPQASRDFRVVGGPATAESQSFTSVNGRTTNTRTVSYTYRLRPMREGRLRLPGATARTGDGQIYSAAGPALRVDAAYTPSPALPPSDPFAGLLPPIIPDAAPEPVAVGREVLVRAVPDRTEAVLGEPIVVAYTLYSRLTVEAALSKLPAPAGFWMQDGPADARAGPKDAVLGGRPYRSVVLRTMVLIPQQTGILTLEPAEIQGTARVPVLGGWMDRPVPVVLRSEPVRIRVSAPPATGRPADYSGAVGSLRFEAVLDTLRITTDGAARLTLRARGRAGFPLLTLPTPRFPPGVEWSGPQTRDSLDGITATGWKEAVYTLTAESLGIYEIPRVSFSVFDPGANAYRTTASAPLRLSVVAGTGRSEAARPSAAGRHIAWWKPALLAAALAGAAALVLWRAVPRNTKKEKRKIAGPLPETLAAPASHNPPLRADYLSPALEAAAVREDVPAVASGVLGGVRRALCDVFPAASATRAALLAALEEKNPALASRAGDLWNRCEALRYAPEGSASGLGAAATLLQEGKAVVQSIAGGSSARTL